ncbi:hypothetical protein BZA70DRAFT_238537 [Myxozyma melibiosi]|uniref:CID domain-containing protein n=1 Tax=Myxozyma melibiosi TaxID=54550 RepID=A0ABR1F5K0_9ASCO
MQEELEDIRQEYATSLEELTFNSKPIISNLTIIAQENMQAAEVISRTIEDHIGKCAPGHKLPVLYLLDSICKNIGSPYTTLFGRNLYRTFTDAYTLVNDAIRKKMHELFQTWKQPVPSTGQPLFPNEPLRRIENYLNKARSAVLEIQQNYVPPFRSTPPTQHARPAYAVPDAARGYPSVTAAPASAGSGYSAYAQAPESGNGYQGYVENKPAAAAPVTKASLTAELSTLIELTREKIQDNPGDVDAGTQLSALTQLFQIVSSSDLPQNQLQTIKDELNVLAEDLRRNKNKRKAAMAADAAPPPAKRQTPMWTAPTPASVPLLPQQQPVNQLNLGALQPDLLAQLLASVPQQPQPQQQYASNANALTAALAGIPGFGLPIQQQPQQASANDAAALFASLMSAGLINAPAAPARQNRMLEKIMGPDVELSNKFIQKPRPDFVFLLYDSLPLLCGTCGRRFADTERDRKIRDAHLDWHFRVNKRLRDDSRGQSRSWYLGEEAWIQSADADADSSKTGGGAERAKKMQEVSQKYILTPKEASVVNTPCPICMEKFKSVWNEKAEDWVWMNAIKHSNGKIYHGTCAFECGLL